MSSASAYARYQELKDSEMSSPPHDAFGSSEPTPADAQIKHADSIKYWEEISSDVNGMLGGYPHVSRVDIQGSRAFLVKCGISASKPVVRAKRTLGGASKSVEEKKDENEKPKDDSQGEEPKVEEKRLKRVVDCGAGIGRITKDLLLSLSTTVDIVEPIRKFTAELVGVPGIGDIYNVGLESFTPKEGIAYDLIWNQWCVGHLTDAQLAAYLRKCGSLLAKDHEGKTRGLVIVKENLAPVVDVFDEEDSSVTRTEEKFKTLFKEAGLRIVRTELQKGFPRELYAVRIWALQPEVTADVAGAA